jgi:tetratricopeptide (TPR) repeat protein
MGTYDLSNRSERFGRLFSAAIAAIARLEGKTEATVQAELGMTFDRSGKALERWKTGLRPRDPQIIQALAEAGVRRGLLGRLWAEQFLTVTGFPSTRELLDDLAPAPQAQNQLPRRSTNLIRRPGGAFVARPHALAAVVTRLNTGALVLITGRSGSGKTSLARVVGERCLSGDPGFPAMKAVVWVSDKDHPGGTALVNVLNTVARVLNWRSLLQLDLDEQASEIANLLGTLPTLLIVDNYESISDPALTCWLRDLPEPSQVLITSSLIPPLLRDHAYIYDLPGMDDHEARTFVTQRLAFLGVPPTAITHPLRDRLITATGGNPKLIEVALGLVRHEHRPLELLLDDLREARGPLSTQATEILFARAHDLLDEAGWQTLLALTLFPADATASALESVTCLPSAALDAALYQLSGLGLVETSSTAPTGTPRYALPPLARAAVDARYANQRDLVETMQRHRIAESRQLVASIVLREGMPNRYWSTLQSSRMNQLDPDWSNVEQALIWAINLGEDEQLLELMLMLTHYLDLRALYEQRERFAHAAVTAAQRLVRPGDAAILQIDALGWMLIEFGRLDEAEATIRAGLASAHALPEGKERDDLLALGHAFLSRVHIHQGKLDAAHQQAASASAQAVSAVVRSRTCWIAGDVCLTRGDYQGALNSYQESSQINTSYGGEARSHGALMIGFTRLALDQIDEAERQFATSMTLPTAESPIADLYALYGLACVATRRGEYELARKRAEEVRDQLQRLCHNHRLMELITTLLKNLAEGISTVTIASLII